MEPMIWARAHLKIASLTLMANLDRNWSSFQLAKSTFPLSVTDNANAPSARMPITTCAEICFYIVENNIFLLMPGILGIGSRGKVLPASCKRPYTPVTTLIHF